MESNNLTQVNVFFKISDPLYSEIIDISQEIYKKYKTNFCLDHSLGKNHYLPHLSLYLFALPKSNLPTLLEKSKEIANEMKPVRLKAEEIIAGKNNVILLQFEKKNILYQYHLKALNTLNPIREEVQRKKYADEKYLKKLENKHRKYIKRYGRRFILDQYHPHISITEAKTYKQALEITKKYKDKFKGKETKIEELCIMKDNYKSGNAEELIFSQNL